MVLNTLGFPYAVGIQYSAVAGTGMFLAIGPLDLGWLHWILSDRDEAFLGLPEHIFEVF